MPPAHFYELLASSIFSKFSLSAMKNVPLHIRSLADRGELKSLSVTMWEFCLFIIQILDKKRSDGRLASALKLWNKSKSLWTQILKTRGKILIFLLCAILGLWTTWQGQSWDGRSIRPFTDIKTACPACTGLRQGGQVCTHYKGITLSVICLLNTVVGLVSVGPVTSCVCV